ncbi:MAG: DUF4440 domain-containing protein [Bacteroidota bacterium]
MSRSFFLLAILYFLTVGTSAAQNDDSKTLKIIKKNIDQFSKDLMAGDYDAVVDAYTKDGKVFPGGMDILSGSDSVRWYWTRNLDKGYKISYHKIFPEEIRITGDGYAYDYGYYEGKSEFNGKPSSWQGKYVIVWKEVKKDTWKIYLDIWNATPKKD